MDWLASASLNSAFSNTGSGLLGEKDGSAIFDALLQRQNGLETLANQFLQTGIDQYLNKSYAQAAKSFEAAVGLAPSSAYNVESSQYLVQSYLQLGETDKAIATYQAAIQRNPQRDDLSAALGKLYYAEERYTEAAAQYRAAVQVRPSATNRYAYGEALLKVKNFSQAEHQFREVKRLEPQSHVGDYGLGKLYAQQKDFDQAIAHFERALALEATFYDALAESGYAYADMGEIEKARHVLEDLAELDQDLALTLEGYIGEKEPPRIAFAHASSSFPYSGSRGYPVSAIDAYLQHAGATASVSMKFLFTKPMDPASVENRFNWDISRAASHNLAETYNFGDAIPSTEIALDPFPDYVVYDRDTRTATVGLTIRQNQSADGTIDPAHIVFKFEGADINGIAMDRDGDQFSGFTGSA